MLLQDLKPTKNGASSSHAAARPSTEQFRKPAAKPSLLSGIIVRPKAAATAARSSSVAATPTLSTSATPATSPTASIVATPSTRAAATVSAAAISPLAASGNGPSTLSESSKISTDAAQPSKTSGGLAGLANLAAYSSGSDSE